MTKIALATIATVFVAAALAAGCDALPFFGDEEPPPVPPTVAPPPAPAMPQAPTPQQPAAPAAPAPAPAPQPAAQPEAGAAPQAEFQWTEAPAFNNIPEAPIEGMLDGEPFEVESVVFEPGEDAWRMIISEEQLPGPTEPIEEGQFVSIDLPAAPATGMTWMHPMSEGDGYFQIVEDPDQPTETSDWEADNAWALEIRQWQANDYDPEGPENQSGGTASGRIALCYKGGSDGPANSWIAGVFEGATVRYLGRPYWLDGEPEKEKEKKSDKGSASAKQPSQKTPAKDEEPAAGEDKGGEKKEKDKGQPESKVINVDVNMIKDKVKKAKEKLQGH